MHFGQVPTLSAGGGYSYRRKNCSIAVTDLKSFGSPLFLLLCGATVKLATVARSSNAAALSADNGVRRKVLFDNTGCAAKNPDLKACESIGE